MFSQADLRAHGYQITPYSVRKVIELFDAKASRPRPPPEPYRVLVCAARALESPLGK